MGGKSVPVYSKKIIAVSLLFAICSPSLCLGKPDREKQRAAIPETPAGQQLDGFLRAYNTGDLNSLRKFIAEHFDRDALAQRSADERASTGVATFKITRQLNLYRIERATDYEVEALCQSGVTEAWFSLTIQVAPLPPHRITNQAFGFASRPADAVPHRKLRATQIAQQLNSYLAKLVAADMLSGAVLVAKHNKPIFEKAYGSNNSKAPNAVDTKFDLASLTKMFTSVAIAQLVQRGKLSYGDSIGKYLADYPNKSAAEKVTLHHLLTHTSGLAEYSDKKEYRPARQAGGRFKRLKDWFPYFANDALAFEPGAKSDYSNSNFIVLGVILEKVTGQSYFDYVREHIFKPAGMNNTVLNVATGNSAGGGLSTVEDLLSFTVALRKHKLLSAKYTDIILASKITTGEGEGYGYGFEARRVNGRRIVGHSGGGEADNNLDMFLDDDYTVVILAKPYAGRNITRKLRELIIGDA
jgi:CubicO group peptidase (beta-lactamase class C family)